MVVHDHSFVRGSFTATGRARPCDRDVNNGFVVRILVLLLNLIRLSFRMRVHRHHVASTRDKSRYLVNPIYTGNNGRYDGPPLFGQAMKV